MNKTKTIRYILLIVFCLSGFSCKKTFTIVPENVLVGVNSYQDVNDADAAIFGIYGKFVGVMDRYIVQNELRADLLDVTKNSDKYLIQLNEHSETTDNPWVDPKPYYSIILDCNDVMNNFNIMLANKRISQANYNVRYSEVAAVWAWVYLQVGIHYGNVPYYTSSLANVTDLNDSSKYPYVNLDQLLDKLIAVMSALPNLQPIELIQPQGVNLITTDGASLIRTIDTYNTARMFLNKQHLLGDLYLWKGNYPLASHYLRMPMEYGAIMDPTQTDLFTNYMRESSLILGGSGWINEFLSSTDNDEKDEIITDLPFDRSFAPGNPFINLFSHGGKYLLKPSALAIKNWTSQTRTDLSPGDVVRGVGASVSTTIAAEPEVKKLLGAYVPTQPFATNGKIILSRGGQVIMHYAESANRDGRDEIASGVINTGFSSGIFGGPPPVPANVTNIMQNFDPNPDYYIDARHGSFPQFGKAWLRFFGMRGYAGLTANLVDSTKYFDMSNKGEWEKPITDPHGLMLALEDRVIFEDALETAYEGVRWGDLLRVSLHREKEAPGTGLAYLEAKIALKFTTAGLPVPAGVLKLGTSTANWYMPFKL